jgi:exosortase
MGPLEDSPMDAPAARSAPLTPREWGLAALLALAFAPALLSLAEVWRAVDYQSHGFLVPLVALWVALRERYAWRRLPVAPDLRGPLVLAGAFAAYLAGLALGSVSLQGVALVGALAGAVLYARGPAWLRRLGFPIAYLLFMVPVPPTWIAPLIVRLQLFVSAASVQLLRAFGVAVAREGNVIVLAGGESLFVDEACSGVTSVITLAPLAVLLAYLSLRRPGTRLALVAAVVPIAMAGNLARVLVTVFAALRFGAQAATEGPPHQLLGLVTYGVAVALMLALAALLRRAEAPARA